MNRRPFPEELDRYLIFTPRTKGELRENAVGPFLYSPDRYPVFPEIRPEFQSTHDSEFFLLHEGVEYALSAPRFMALRDELHDILHQAYDAFLGDKDDQLHGRVLMDRFMAKVSEAK